MTVQRFFLTENTKAKFALVFVTVRVKLHVATEVSISFKTFSTHGAFEPVGEEEDGGGGLNLTDCC